MVRVGVAYFGRIRVRVGLANLDTVWYDFFRIGVEQLFRGLFSIFEAAVESKTVWTAIVILELDPAHVE